MKQLHEKVKWFKRKLNFNKHYKHARTKIKNRLSTWLNIQSHIEALEHEKRFWEQEYQTSLTDIDQLNTEIHECWHKQQITETLLSELNQQIKECQQKQSSAEFELAKIKRASALEKQKADKYIALLEQELNHHKVLVNLNNETISLLAQSQTDLFFEGKLQALRGWPLVSIILPVWNQADLLDVTIQSILQQTYPYWELVIIDDGSTDNTKQKLNAYLKDNRIDYYLKEHGGTHEARNIGLAKCSGEFIAYLNPEKTWSTHVLSVVVNSFLCDDNCKAVRFAGLQHDHADNSKHVHLPENTLDLNCFVHHRSLYEQLGKYTQNLRHLSESDLTGLYQKQASVKNLGLLGTHSRMPSKTEAVAT